MMLQDTIELIIVFKKEIGLHQAENILGKSEIIFREGMDSSKSRKYFYSTGPKFILTFESEKDRNEFSRSYKKMKEVYEVYIPDWTIQKD